MNLKRLSRGIFTIIIEIGLIISNNALIYIQIDKLIIFFEVKIKN
jgi:hypothetical protein